MTFVTGGSAGARTAVHLRRSLGAQARGDFQLLAERGCRALRLHLDGYAQEGLTKLEHVVRQALA
jgi:hypothetical protein